MNKNYFLGLAMISAVGFLAVQRSGSEMENYFAANGHKLNSAGAPAGRTGAPGESNCAECHSGGTQSGTGINTLYMLDGGTIVTNYTPGSIYNMSLALSTGSVKEGFQATVLDLTNNQFVGDFPGTGGFGTAITTFNGRDYANHTSTSNDEGNLAWVWQWQAPATDVGPVRFYVATNIANGNNNSTGDAIYLSEHIFGSTAGISEVENEVTDFTAGYSSSLNSVMIGFSSKTVDNMFFNLVDMNGKSVFTAQPGNSALGENKLKVTLPDGIRSGMYVVNFFIGNKPMSAKVLVQ